jgi:hypothetical protein
MNSDGDRILVAMFSIPAPAWRTLRHLATKDEVKVEVTGLRLLCIPRQNVDRAKVLGNVAVVVNRKRQAKGCRIFWRGHEFCGADVIEATDSLLESNNPLNRSREIRWDGDSAWRLLRTLARGEGALWIIARNKGLLGKPADMGEVELTIRPGMTGCIIVWNGERYPGSDVTEAAANLRHRLKCLAKLIQPKGHAA